MVKTYTILTYRKVFKLDNVTLEVRDQLPGLTHHEVIREIWRAKARNEPVDIYCDTSKNHVAIDQFVND